MHENISDEAHRQGTIDEADGEQLYRTEDGTLVKVTAETDPHHGSGEGDIYVKVTPFVVDEGGNPLYQGQPHWVIAKIDGMKQVDTDLHVAVEQGRQKVVDDIVSRHKTVRAATTVPGLKVRAR